VTTGCGDVDVGGCWDWERTTRIVGGGGSRSLACGSGESMRASHTGCHRGRPHSPLPRAAAASALSLVEEWLSHVATIPLAHCFFLRVSGLAFLNQHISHSDWLLDTGPVAQARGFALQSGMVKSA